MHISRGNRRGSIEGFSLNIVPIVDALTILIIFMLAAGVFYSYALLDLRVNTGSANPSQERPDVQITVRLEENRATVLELTGKERARFVLPAANDQRDREALAEKLTSIKKKWPNVKSATLITHKDVSYEEVIGTLEVTKKTHSEVSLGGF